MDTIKSLDELELIATLLLDISNVHGVVFNTRAVSLTLEKVKERCLSEGISFLTKTLPKLGKALDKALSGSAPLDAVSLGFKPLEGSKLPIFMGELFQKVLNSSGELLPDPCSLCVKSLRQLLYLFYKYELPYTVEQEQAVLDQFILAERELTDNASFFSFMEREVSNLIATRSRPRRPCRTNVEVAREARILLARVFSRFNPYDIVPRHGPGAVATRQRLSEKYLWTNVSSRITAEYPLDEYFYSSLAHVCDRVQEMNSLTSVDNPARVILVPKDSRGPRLISCEPVDFQWIQQGLRGAIYQLVESHPLTRDSVYFTNQEPNRNVALIGSVTGKYATLDLKEASDRVSLGLVRLLFPQPLLRCLEATRTQQTQLPNGQLQNLVKFAPMGSALCFPVMALTIWALLQAGLSDDPVAYRGYSTRGCEALIPLVYVYGDDVIVQTAQAERAIELLESFGLKINRDKSCTNGFFRESCGMDAFKGLDVTPIKLRTVWSSSPSANVYESWIEYANSFFDRRCLNVYNYITECLVDVYDEIPGEELGLTSVPTLREGPVNGAPSRSRTHPKGYQKRQWKVWTVKCKHVEHEIDGWSMLLRYFTEGSRAITDDFASERDYNKPDANIAFSVRSYTERNTSMLVKRWR